MLRILLGLVLLSACSMGTVKKGGDKSYVYDVHSDYNQEDLRELSPKVVTTLKREPRVGKLEALFGPGQRPLKRIGIVIFESIIQPTVSGLASDNKVYLSEAGKQIFTEDLLRIWDQSFPILGPEVDYVSVKRVKGARSLHQYGSPVPRFVKGRREALAPDDIFFLESGRKTTSTTVVNPRGMQDLSFLLVPAYELMSGPKWSEHNKHFLNDIARELKLDALIIVMSRISWTAAHLDRFSHEYEPEEISLEVDASTLIPLAQYNERLKNLNVNETPDVTLCYRAYESKIKIPSLISLAPEDQDFKSIQREILAPTFKAYKDLTQMTIDRIISDLKKTW